MSMTLPIQIVAIDLTIEVRIWTLCLFVSHNYCGVARLAQHRLFGRNVIDAIQEGQRRVSMSCSSMFGGGVVTAATEYGRLSG